MLVEHVADNVAEHRDHDRSAEDIGESHQPCDHEAHRWVYSLGGIRIETARGWHVSCKLADRAGHNQRGDHREDYRAADRAAREREGDRHVEGDARRGTHEGDGEEADLQEANSADREFSSVSRSLGSGASHLNLLHYVSGLGEAAESGTQAAARCTRPDPRSRRAGSLRPRVRAPTPSRRRRSLGRSRTGSGPRQLHERPQLGRSTCRCRSTSW